MLIKKLTMKYLKAVGLFQYGAFAYLRWKAWRLGMQIRRFSRDGVHILCIRNGSSEIWLKEEHFVYAEDAMQAFPYYFESVRPRREGACLVADFSKPAWHVLKGSGTSHYFTTLPESEETTELYLEILQIDPGAVILDLGAYCGASTLALAHACGPTGRVFAFEPDPANFSALQTNIAKSTIRNVTARNQAVWSSAKTLLFQADGSLGSAAAAFVSRQSKAVAVKTVVLDEFVAVQGLTKINAIKMDIEGAEVEVLRSSVELLRRFRPRLAIEPHCVNGTLNIPEVVATLSEAGYQSEVVSQGKATLPLIVAVPLKPESEIERRAPRVRTSVA